ncbi:RHS repeat-associated core domain-containing protein [Pseudomonas coronafaciens]|uniref:RHS repeat-associated core domain-containing protein n=1 Tax=Pseudomonas coronafaciens TaxID=53409 RepID=UPI001F3CD870|nr:RHS repeat-associated core domain-containing protein [Pseudomonas coronafaciens]
MVNSAVHSHTPELLVSEVRGLVVRQVLLHRIEAAEAAAMRVTKRRFDLAGRMIAATDPRLADANRSTVYSLGGNALATESVDAGWQRVLFGEAGQVLHGWDGRGTERQLEYDLLLRPTRIIEQNRCAERFTYGQTDAAGHNQCNQLVRHDDTAGSRLLQDYSLHGSVLSETRHFMLAAEAADWPSAEPDRNELLEPAGLQTCRVFNAQGEVLTQTDASGNSQLSTHNLAGQLHSTDLILNDSMHARTLVSAIRYNAFNQVEQETAGNGVVSLYAYDQQDGRLIGLSAISADGTLLQQLNYSYDPVGNILLVNDASQPDRYCDNQLIEPISRYRYDTLYQLIEASGREVRNGASHGPALPGLQPVPTLDPCQVSNYRQNYSYDAVGNLLQMRHEGAHNFTRNIHVAPDSNRSLPDDDGDVDFATSFDANGNLLQLVRGQVMGWDARNQLQHITTVQREDGSNDDERYVYDGQGQRCRKISTAQASGRTLTNEVRYLPGLEIRTTADGEILHVVTTQAGRNSVRVLHWEAGKPDAIANDQVRYSLGDHLGSSTLELDQQGGLISQESYYPFGGTAWWAARSAVEAKYKTVRYSGKERDASGLYYYGFRYYAPWLQRWINPDVSGEDTDLNLYRMLKNNPLNHVDLKGNVAIPLNAHFYWEGGDIPIPHLQNMLLFKEINPDYQVNVWTSKVKHLLNPLAEMSESNDPAERHLALAHGDSLIQCNPEELFSSLGQAYPNAKKIEAIYSRETNGPYKNYAAASDIIELASTYMEGGLYMDADIAVGQPLGSLDAPNGFLVHIEDNLTSNAVLASEPRGKMAGEIMDTIVDLYTTSPSMMENNENYGWKTKRSTPGEGLFSRLKLTMHMTGPWLIRSFLPATAEENKAYAVPHDKFFYRETPRTDNMQPEQRSLSNIFFRGFKRGLNGEGRWTNVRPGRRASI